MHSDLTIVIPTVSEDNFIKIQDKLNTLDQIGFNGSILISFNGLAPANVKYDFQHKSNNVFYRFQNDLIPAFDHFSMCARDVQTKYVMFSADDDVLCGSFADIPLNEYQQKSLICFPVSCKHGNSKCSLVQQEFIGQTLSSEIFRRFSDLHFYAIYRTRVYRKLLSIVEFKWRLCSNNYQHRRKAFLLALAAYSLKKSVYHETENPVIHFDLSHGTYRSLRNLSSISVDIQLIIKMFFFCRVRNLPLDFRNFGIFALRRIKHGFLK